MATNIKANVTWNKDGIPSAASIAFRDELEPHQVIDALLTLSGELGRRRIDRIK